MRISDWSSDVCSSDLVKRLVRRGRVTAARRHGNRWIAAGALEMAGQVTGCAHPQAQLATLAVGGANPCGLHFAQAERGSRLDGARIIGRGRAAFRRMGGPDIGQRTMSVLVRPMAARTTAS